MLDIEIVRSPRYHENLARHKGTSEPCSLCGKTIKGEPKWLVRVHGGGSLIVTDEEADNLNAAGREAADMYSFPVGPECAKKSALKPYLNGG